MPQYLLNIVQPDGAPPPPDVLEPIMREVNALNAEMKQAGVWLFAGGLQPPDAASVVRFRDGQSMITDGPYIESKEHIGGFWVIEAADRDAAQDWARRAARATTLPIELRPFQDVPQG